MNEDPILPLCLAVGFVMAGVVYELSGSSWLSFAAGVGSFILHLVIWIGFVKVTDRLGLYQVVE